VAVDCILRMLDSGIPENARKRRRIRSLAHIINLVAKAFLLGEKAEKVKDELAATERHKDDEEMSIFKLGHDPTVESVATGNEFAQQLI
jgi:hypothetical protein